VHARRFRAEEGESGKVSSEGVKPERFGVVPVEEPRIVQALFGGGEAEVARGRGRIGEKASDRLEEGGPGAVVGVGAGGEIAETVPRGDEGEVVEGVRETGNGEGAGIRYVDARRGPGLNVPTGDEQGGEPGGLEGIERTCGDQFELAGGGRGQGDAAGEADISGEGGGAQGRRPESLDRPEGIDAGFGEAQPGLRVCRPGRSGREEILSRRVTSPPREVTSTEASSP
jgi:hypothetical protein